MWLQYLDSSSPWTLVLLCVYLLMEATFLAVFMFYVVPRCNKRTAPKPYRDYGKDRHQLFLRILSRMERTCRARNRKLRPVLDEFMSNWFQRGRRPPQHTILHNSNNMNSVTPPPLMASPSMTSELSFDDSWSNDGLLSSIITTTTDDDDDDTTLGLHKEDVDDFLSGAFFGKTCHDLKEWEVQELQNILDLFLQRTKRTFLLPGKSPSFRPLRLSLEDVDPIPRPLLVYVVVALIKQMANLLLRVFGFQRYTSKSGLVYWFRPSSSTSTTSLDDDDDHDAKEKHLPFLFFHGIAPAGFTLYLPMVLYGLANDCRPIFLFENPTISCTLGFQALTEEETIQGVQEALSLNVHPDADITLCGHSFGSCQLTWLLHSPLQRRIKQFILLDPVSILLSEPDVLANFLYSNPCTNNVARCDNQPPPPTSWHAQLWDWLVRAQMRLAVSSEVFTEYYLRRHFSWYNSELWLDDLPPHVQVLVCLAERDEITCTAKVVEEIAIHNSQLPDTTTPKVQVIFWNKVGHGYCLTSPKAWQSMKKIMLEQETVVINAKHQ